jgi:hypothetical protein
MTWYIEGEAQAERKFKDACKRGDVAEARDAINQLYGLTFEAHKAALLFQRQVSETGELSRDERQRQREDVEGLANQMEWYITTGQALMDYSSDRLKKVGELVGDTKKLLDWLKSFYDAQKQKREEI